MLLDVSARLLEFARLNMAHIDMDYYWGDDSLEGLNTPPEALSLVSALENGVSLDLLNCFDLESGRLDFFLDCYVRYLWPGE